ncbi:MAG: indole-3-glycerol phosphate synthase TrpC [Solirubrobacteraceae bacterium]
MSFLQEVLERTQEVVAERQARRSLQELRAGVRPRPDGRPFLRAVQAPGISLIAEFKRSSPSHPRLAPRASVARHVKEYERGHASAVSILTEESYFSGSLEDLRMARAGTRLPLLRKDFVVDEYQLYEAAEVGADAVLLIAAVLRDPGRLRNLYELARTLNLDVLLEIRDEPELARAISLNADLIGVNNRELETPASAPRSFEVDVGRTARLYGAIPQGVSVVAESGLKARAELEELAALGVQAALVGSALMQASDPEAKCRELAGPVRAPSPAHPAFA